MMSGTDPSSRKTTHATRKEPPPLEAATRGKRQMLPVPTAMPSMATNMPKRLVKKLALRSVTTVPRVVQDSGLASASAPPRAGSPSICCAQLAPDPPGRSARTIRSDDALAHPADQVVRANALLLERVAVPNGHRAILHRLPVDRDAPRRARLVLPAVAPADRARIVVERRNSRGAQCAVQFIAELGHAIL